MWQPAAAVCTGRWKLIVRKESGNAETYELYDLAEEPGETSDGSQANPAVTKELTSALNKAEAAGRTRP